MPSYPGLSEAQTFIATLAAQYPAAPTEADKAGKAAGEAALELILQDIDGIIARMHAGTRNTALNQDREISYSGIYAPITTLWISNLSPLVCQASPAKARLGSLTAFERPGWVER